MTPEGVLDALHIKISVRESSHLGYHHREGENELRNKICYAHSSAVQKQPWLIQPDDCRRKQAIEIPLEGGQDLTSQAEVPLRL